MAFSLRKMFSNISYFNKSGDNTSPDNEESDEVIVDRCNNTPHMYNEPSRNIVHHTEADSTSKACNSLKLPESVMNFAAKKGSLSDTDLDSINNEPKKCRKKSKSLKLDIKKASQSMTECTSHSDNAYIINTPKYKLLDCKSADVFSEKFKKLNLGKSFEFDLHSDMSEEDIDIESLSEVSDSDASGQIDDKGEIKMCRKVEVDVDNQLMPSASPESFGDIEFDTNEKYRNSLLIHYQMKFEKMESILKSLLAEFEFHIVASKIFQGPSAVSSLPNTGISSMPKTAQVKYIEDLNRDSPIESWNMTIENEPMAAKRKLQTQLTSLKNCLDMFTTKYLQNQDSLLCKQFSKKSLTFDLHKGRRRHKIMKQTNKKRYKHFDFPDLRDALLNLFKMESNVTDTTVIDCEEQKCNCQCHNHSLNETDSGVTTRSDTLLNQSITSSIGNFTLDSLTLSAYSESLDQIISFDSFDDSSLMNTLLQKPAIERITFYIQVHSTQIRCVSTDCSESKHMILFYCPACEITESDEYGLLKHIFNQKHCERIHFLYKTSYIKKCVSSGREIQPSTVLNPMKMYRDDNKIVCFGDAMFACSLCFENLIVGESVLMAHCADQTHLERKNKLDEMLH